jgi:hypothetical protein
MANCPNCKKKLSCGCQKRQASDGKTVSPTSQVWGKDRYKIAK